MKRFTLIAGAALCAASFNSASAHEGDGGKVAYASDHAPIGVMADHRHKQGAWMLSYRWMYMDMDGSRDGTDSISPDETATTVANPYAPPATLRVVPLRMPMQMHMVGGMYGLTDRITLMAMGNYLTEEMDHVTFQGMMGTTRLGEFTTESSGIGDTTVGLIYGLDSGSDPHTQVNLGLALSLPTGSITESDQVLTPMGTTPSLRMPYPMQHGSGTFDFKPSLTARTRHGKWTLGGQGAATIRIDDNDEGYSLGDVVEATGWVAYEPRPFVSISGRLKAKSTGKVDGSDPLVRAPVQTADPDNHGGETLEALFGVNLAGQTGWMTGHRLSAEVGLPLYRDLNGPQLETDFTFTLGWQKSF
jgi:hypothetical protein